MSAHAAVRFRPGEEAPKHLDSFLKQLRVWRTVWCLQPEHKQPFEGEAARYSPASRVVVMKGGRTENTCWPKHVFSVT